MLTPVDWTFFFFTIYTEDLKHFKMTPYLIKTIFAKVFKTFRSLPIQSYELNAVAVV